MKAVGLFLLIGLCGCRTVSPAPETQLAVQPLTPAERKEIHLQQAEEYRKTGDLPAAVREWQRALALDPSDGKLAARIRTARTLQASAGQADSAELSFKREMQVRFLMGTEYFKEGRYREAIREWEWVLKKDPEHELSRQKIQVARERMKER